MFKNWQQEYERDHQMQTWLTIILIKTDATWSLFTVEFAINMKPACNSLKTLPGAWIAGMKNQKVSNVVDHAGSNVHEDWHGQGQRWLYYADTINCSMGTLDIEAWAHMKQTRVIAFNKCPTLLQLEQHHGINVGHCLWHCSVSQVLHWLQVKSQNHGFLTWHADGWYTWCEEFRGRTDCHSLTSLYVFELSFYFFQFWNVQLSLLKSDQSVSCPDIRQSTFQNYNMPCKIFFAFKFLRKIFITNQKTQRQTEAVAVTIITPHGHCEHSIANWDWTLLNFAR